jgi:hypothetical protein
MGFDHAVSIYHLQLPAPPLIKVRRTHVFNTFGYKWSFNPHKFNMKEHTIIVVMANASFAGGVAYATDILLVQEVFYKQFFGWVSCVRHLGLRLTVC